VAFLSKAQCAGFLIVKHLYPKDGGDWAKVLHVKLIAEDTLETQYVALVSNQQAVINVDGDDEDVPSLALDVDAGVRRGDLEATGMKVLVDCLVAGQRGLLKPVQAFSQVADMVGVLC